MVQCFCLFLVYVFERQRGWGREHLLLADSLLQWVQWVALDQAEVKILELHQSRLVDGRCTAPWVIFYCLPRELGRKYSSQDS